MSLLFGDAAITAIATQRQTTRNIRLYSLYSVTQRSPRPRPRVTAAVVTTRFIASVSAAHVATTRAGGASAPSGLRE
jgi:hypothetical protein